MGISAPLIRRRVNPTSGSQFMGPVAALDGEVTGSAAVSLARVSAQADGTTTSIIVITLPGFGASFAPPHKVQIPQQRISGTAEVHLESFTVEAAGVVTTPIPPNAIDAELRMVLEQMDRENELTLLVLAA